MTNRKPLFIFEMANNHMGSVEHGLRILQETAAVTQEFRGSFDRGFEYPIPEPRYLYPPPVSASLRTSSMSRDSRKRAWRKATFYGFMRTTVSLAFVPICTPFDEASVDAIEQHGHPGNQDCQLLLHRLAAFGTHSQVQQAGRGVDSRRTRRGYRQSRQLLSEPAVKT